MHVLIPPHESHAWADKTAWSVGVILPTKVESGQFVDIIATFKEMDQAASFVSLLNGGDGTVVPNYKPVK